MNGSLVRWLFDLETIPEGAEGLRLVWERAWPPWLWALLVAASVLFAVWSYRRLAGARSARGALAVLRAGTIVLALLIIAGPMIELPRETVEQDWVLVLVDRSASMQVADAEVGRASCRERV